MVRKTSDIALLLGARGRGGARRIGVLRTVTSWLDRLAGRPSWRNERSGRGRQVPGWAALVGVVIALIGGYLAGARFGGPVGAAGLDAKPKGVQPEVIGATDTAVLASRALIVADFPAPNAEQAAAQAKALADELRRHGIDRARPYEMVRGALRLWVTLVYFDGEQEREQALNKLRELADQIRDERWLALQKSEKGWPREWQVR